MPRLKEFRWDSWADWAEARLAEDAPAAIAIDTETEGVAFHDRAFCATLTWRTKDGGLRSAYIDLEAEGWERRAFRLRTMLHSVPTWVFWNAKFDLQKLDLMGVLDADEIDLSRIEDGQVVASLLNENQRMALKVRAVEDLGYVDTIEVEVKSGPNKGKKKRVAREAHRLNEVRRKLKLKKEDGYHLLPREVIIPYALKDTELTLRWWEKKRPELPDDLEQVYREELAAQFVLLDMEAEGVGIDVPYLEETTDEWGALVMERMLVFTAATGKDDFNPNSHQQIREAFQAAGVTLESTDKVAMRDVLKYQPSSDAVHLAEVLLAYREAEKIYGTYLRPLRDEQRDGIAHPWFNFVGPRTGRLSSSKAVA